MSSRPEWLTELTNGVCSALYAAEEMPPIGCHVAKSGETWEISLFISPTEIVGGEHDGERLSCLFFLDLLELMHLFDVVESVNWQPHELNENDELRNHVSVTGYYHGHSIWLRVLADSPERFEPGRFAHLNEQKIHDTWY